MESKRRFVLFPIQYHEVRPVVSMYDTFAHVAGPLDLANVQEG